MNIEWLQNLFFRAGVDRAAYDQVQPSIRQSNRSSLIVYSAVGLLALVGMFISSFAVSAIAVYSACYLIFALVALAVLVYATVLYPRSPGLLLPCMYVFMGLLFGLGILLGTASDPQSLSVTFIAFLLTIPLLFTDRPLRVILMLLAAMLAFDVTILLTKTGDTLMVDLVDATVFGLLGCVISTHMMTVKVSRIVYSERSDMLSRTDLLTGCKNRNCYEQEVSLHGRTCRQTLACVYVDVNGLHEMNNEHGHTAGDTMLKFVAAQMRACFASGETYRIGGDEFVSLVCDMDPALVDSQVAALRTAVEDRGYHIAIGHDQQQKNVLDLLLLIRTAEERMYRDKEDYYSSRGRQPRKRR